MTLTQRDEKLGFMFRINATTASGVRKPNVDNWTIVFWKHACMYNIRQLSIIETKAIDQYETSS